MADKKKSIEQLLLENEELRLRLAANEAQNDTFREVENKYTAIYNSMSEGLAIHEIIYDNSGNAIDYLIADVNPAYEQIVGLKKKQAVGRKATDVYKVRTAPYLEIYSNVALTGDPQTFETYFPPMDKHFHVSVFSPVKGKFATIFQDISERKRTEKALSESEDRFSSIISNAQDVIYRLNVQTGKYEYISPSAESIIGYSPDELMALDVNTAKSLVHPDDLYKFNDAIKQTEKSGKGIAEYRQLRKNGEYRWLSNHMIISRDKSGLPLYREGNIRDITEQKNIQQIILESEERFRTIAETVPVLVCVTRKADNIVLFTNEVNNKAFGIRGEDIIGTVGPDYYYDPADRKKMMEVFRKQGYVNNYQLKVKRSDGSAFWILTSVRQIDYYGQIALIGASIDITERIKLEQDREHLLMEFESQAAWLDASISSMATGIILYGLDSKAIRMNDTAKKLLPEELFFNLPIQDRSKLIKWETEDGKPFPLEEIPVYRAIRGETTKTVVLVASFSDHKIFLSVNAAPIVDSHGKVLGVVASFLDLTERKKIEEALHESDKRYHQMFDRHQAVGLLIEPETGAIIDANPAAIKYYGYTYEQLCSLQIQDINQLPPDEVEAERKKALKEQRNYFVFPHRLANGEMRWVEVYSSPLSINGRQLLYSIIHDITSRKNAEESLRVSEERFSRAFKNSPNAITLTRLRDGKIIEGNESVFSLLGYKDEDIVGKTTLELGIWTDMADRERLTKGLATKGFIQNEEFVLRKKDGNQVPVNLSASLITIDSEQCFLCSFIDLSERKKAEAALKISEERFRLALKNTPVSVAIQDMNLVYTWAYNQRTRQTDEIIGKTDADLFSPEDIEWINPLKASILESGKEINVEKWITTNGKRLFLGIHYEPILDSSGKIIGIGAATIDLTGRKLAEESLDFQSLLLSEVHDAVFSNDIDFVITYWNKAAEKMFGWTKEEVLGKNSGELLKPKIEDSSRDRERSKLKDIGHWEGEVQYIRKDGTYFFVDVNSTILKDGNGKYIGNVIAARDITERKRTEENLKKSEALYRAIGESIDYGIWICDANGRNTYASESYLKLVGITQEQCSEFGWGDTLHPDDAERTIAAWKECSKKGNIWDIEHRFRGVDGKWHPILARGIPIRDDKNKITMWAGINLDISKIKETEDALRESEERLRVTLSSIGDAVLSADILGKIVFLNPVAVKLLGWDPEEALGRQVQEVFSLINEITLLPAEDIVQQVLLEGKVLGLSNHTALITKDGRHIPIEDSAAPIKDQNGNVIGVILVFHDVTEKRQAQEALRESEERFRNLVKYAPTAIYEIDFKTRKFISVNDAICELSGYSREELLSIDTMELLVEESKELFLSRINQIVKGEKPDENVEYRIKTKDDRIIDAVFNMKFTFNEEGSPDVAMVVGHDITQRKQAEKELREAGEALKVSEKRFRTLAENIPDMIVRFDKNLKLLYGNDAVINRTGRPLDFLTGKTAVEYGAESESDRNWENAAREAIRTGKPCRLEQANLWQGITKVYDALIVPEKDNSGNVNSIISIARDITEMKQAENILRKSEQRLKYHLENSPLAVVEWDNEFNIIQWSNEAERIFGLGRDEVIGVRIDMLNIIYPEDIPIVEKTISRLTSGKETKVVSRNRNITKDGHVRECIWYNSVLLDEKGEISSVMSLVEDITQLKQVENELIESRERYRELVTNAQSMILKFDNDGMFTFVNEFALDFFGYKEEELIGKSVMIVVPQTDSTGRDLNEMVDNIIEDPDSYSININENIKKNGEKVWVEWHNKTLFDQSGNKTGHIAIGIDISKRKKAEGALKESERKLRSVLDATQESIYMFDNEGMVVLSNTRGIRRLNKNTENEVVKHHFSEFMTAEIAAKRMDRINEVFKSGNPMTYEDERESKAYQHNLFPVLKDDEVIYVVTYSTDITDQKRAEISLKQSEDRFRTIAESLTVIVSITKISDSTITFLNEPFEKSFGYKRSEILGTRMPDIYFYPEDNKFLVDSLKVKGLVENVEVRVKKRDGTPFWIMTSIRKINYLNEPSYLTASIDISETKKAQEELLRLNRTLDAQSKSSQAMMHSRNEQEYLNEICKIIIEDCGHAMVWVGYAQNDSHKSVKPVAHFGFDKGYIDQMNITWDDSERGKGPTGTAIKTGKPSICRHMLTDPYFAPWRDAAIKRGYASSVVLPLKSEGKAFGAISIYSKDPDPFTVSEIDLLSELADDLAYGILFIRLSEYEKEATRAIRENEVRLKELISTKDKFFNIIAHDLKNPFTSLLGASELLYDNINQMSGENVKKLALILNDSAKGGYSILQNLLDWSRSQTGQLKFNPENVNLKAIIDENIENLQLQVTNKEINLKSEQIEPILITADKNMINTVLRNLLSNAVKYTFKNGNIRIMVAQDKNKITLTVKDSGIGMSKEKADSLFKLENSLSIPGTAKEQGTGLGLKLCKEFTEKMGGKIWVESEVGKGSEFKFTIPINGVKE